MREKELINYDGIYWVWIIHLQQILTEMINETKWNGLNVESKDMHARSSFLSPLIKSIRLKLLKTQKR